MPENEKKKLSNIPEVLSEENILIENINLRYGVAKPIAHQLIREHGLCLPKIYDELRKLGYPVPELK